MTTSWSQLKNSTLIQGWSIPSNSYLFKGIHCRLELAAKSILESNSLSCHLYPLTLEEIWDKIRMGWAITIFRVSVGNLLNLMRDKIFNEDRMMIWICLCQVAKQKRVKNRISFLNLRMRGHRSPRLITILQMPLSPTTLIWNLLKRLIIQTEILYRASQLTK